MEEGVEMETRVFIYFEPNLKEKKEKFFLS